MAKRPRTIPENQSVYLPMSAIVWMIETLGRIERRLIELERRADANGQQAATWSTPKSWAEAQERPPTQERGRSDG
jgi:hypothetical protein